MPSEQSNAARELVRSQKAGVLGTLSTRLRGYPYASLTNYAADSNGRPLFLFSQLATHTQNLSADPKASLLVFDEEAHLDPLAGARVTLMGIIAPVPAAEIDEGRKTFLDRHPDAQMYVDFGDFALYRMDVTDVYYIAGFGAMGWVDAAEYSAPL